MIQVNAPAELIEKAERDFAAGLFELWPENVDSVDLFLSLQTQWVHTGMGEIVGLNYSSLDFLFKLYGVEDQKSAFVDIQVLEFAVLKERRRQREGAK